MRGVFLVFFACLLAGGIFFAWSRSLQSKPQPLEEVAAAADKIALRWASEGPAGETRILTFVLSGDFAGLEPMDLPSRRVGPIARWFSGNGGGTFLRAMGREPDTVAWSMGALAPESEEEYLDPFARMLIKAGSAGARVRIAAHGSSVVFAVRAAARAKSLRGRGEGVVERVIGVGASARLLSEGAPDIYARAAREAAVSEWINLWSDSRAVARALNVELWRPGMEKPLLSVRPWPPYAWPAIAAAAMSSGAQGLPAEETLEVAPSAPARRASRLEPEKRPSYIEMLEAAKKREDTENTETGDFPIGETGWVARKLKDVEYVAGHNIAATWSASNCRVQVYWARAGSSGWGLMRARERCGRQELKISKATHRGRPVEICGQIHLPETDKPQAYHDYFTIEESGYWITAAYTYWPHSSRQSGFEKFTEIIDSLHPAGR